MSDFRILNEGFAASPQITPADVAEARSRGFTMIVNNRPDQETEDQPSGFEIEQSARAAGMGYRAIPVTHIGFDKAQVSALIEAMNEADGPILAYCRSGTRSTLLWALAQAQQGHKPAIIAAQARAAGYDLSPIMRLVEELHAQSD